MEFLGKPDKLWVDLSLDASCLCQLERKIWLSTRDVDLTSKLYRMMLVWWSKPPCSCADEVTHEMSLDDVYRPSDPEGEPVVFLDE